MKKRCFWLSLLAATFVAASGCGSGDEKTSKQDEANIRRVANEMPSNPPGSLPAGTKGSPPSDP